MVSMMYTERTSIFVCPLVSNTGNSGPHYDLSCAPLASAGVLPTPFDPRTTRHCNPILCGVSVAAPAKAWVCGVSGYLAKAELG